MANTGFLYSSFEQKQKRRDYATLGQSQLVDGRYITAKADTVNVTTAQILAMNGAPVTILPAPSGIAAAKRAWIPTRIVVQLILNTGTPAAFASGGAISFVYHGTSITPCATLAAAQINSLTPTGGFVNVLPSVATAYTPVLGVGIDITNATGAFTTGNGNLQVTFFYDDYCSE